MLLNYHIGRFVPSLLCVGGWVRFGWSSMQAAGCSSATGGFLFQRSPNECALSTRDPQTSKMRGRFITLFIQVNKYNM